MQTLRVCNAPGTATAVGCRTQGAGCRLQGQELKLELELKERAVVLAARAAGWAYKLPMICADDVTAVDAAAAAATVAAAAAAMGQATSRESVIMGRVHCTGSGSCTLFGFGFSSARFGPRTDIIITIAK